MDAQLALALVVLLVLLDLAALKWGAESRDGFQNRYRRYLPVIDPFFTELAGSDRQRRLLAEADRDRLLAAGRRRAGNHRATASFAAFALVATHVALAAAFAIAQRARVVTARVAAAAVARLGLALVASGIRLQQFALGRDAADLEPAVW